MEALLLHQVRDALGLHVHAVDLPVGLGDDAFGQVVADEAVDAEYQDFFHMITRKVHYKMRGYPPRGLSPQGGSRPSGRLSSCTPRSEAISVILKWPLSKSALAQQFGRKLAHRLRRGLRALEREKVPALDALDAKTPARMRQAH